MAQAKRKSKKAGKKKTPPTLMRGDEVAVNRSGVKHVARVEEYDESSGMVVVDFSTEDLPDIPLMIVPLREVSRCNLSEIVNQVEPSTKVHEKQKGFHQYDIEWVSSEGKSLYFNRDQHDNPRKALRCKAVVEGVVFSGFINKARARQNETVWQILIYANYEGRPYALSPIVYDKDPRIPGSSPEMSEDGESEGKSNWSGMRDLNADLCVAMNKWLHFHAGGNVQTVSDLRSQAQSPRIQVRSFEDLEQLISDLVSLYNKSARSGGYRSAFLTTPDSDVVVCVEAELTSEVIRSYHAERHIGSIDPQLEEPTNDLVDDGVERPKDYTEVVGKRKSKSKKSKGKPFAELSGKSTDDLLDLKEGIQETPKRERTPDQLKLERAVREELRKRR